MRILLLTLSLLFTQELEVQGDLKVSGSIDAQNNPVKNVGVPQSLTDAINGNVLQDALRDDGPFEYKIYLTQLNGSNYYVDIKYFEYIEGQPNPYGDDAVDANISNFHDELFLLLNAGWRIDQTINYNYAGGTQSNNYLHAKQLIIFKRPIEE